MNSAAIALVGDYSPRVPAHRGIPRALEMIHAETGLEITWRWIGTPEVRNAASDLAHFSAVWLVPASPYKNMAGALAAVRWARETRRPFLGTCGGFQHAALEFARNVAGLTAAAHAESDPQGHTLIIAPLSCPLVESGGDVHFTPGSLIHAAYAQEIAHEIYHCSYGFNSAYRAQLEQAGLRFTAFDKHGDIRAAELSVDIHPFFVGTLFQPERAALQGKIPPLVTAFVRAAAQRASGNMSLNT